VREREVILGISVLPCEIVYVTRDYVSFGTGLDMSAVTGLNLTAGPSLGIRTAKTRTLKYTYGIEISDPGDPSRRGRRSIFKRLAQRGTEVPIDSKFGCELISSCRDQTQMKISIYTTCEDAAKYCNDPGVELFGQLAIGELLMIRKYMNDCVVNIFSVLIIASVFLTTNSFTVEYAPNTNIGLARSVDFSLIFRKTDIKAQAKDKLFGNTSEALFALER